MATTIKHLKVGGTTYDIGATTADSMGEANLTWGGKNYSGTFGPLDAALIPSLGANRFAFANPAGITIEYSTDGGSTWVDYGATEQQKLALTSTGNCSFTVGKRSAAGSSTVNDQLRITFDTSVCGVYSELTKFCIYLSTEGSGGCTCTIDKATHSSPSNFSTAATSSVSGWSGYNIINTGTIVTYGNSDYQYQKLRFTFKISTVNTSYRGLTVYSIFAFGGVGWTSPSTLAKRGDIYTYDEYKRVTFPSQVTATSFSGSGESLTSLNASNVSSGTLSADRLATSGVTAGSYGPTANVTGTNDTTITVPQITVDNKGRVTSVVNRTYTSKDTSYSLPTATSSVLGGVKIGNNISVSSGTISLTKDNVTAALGYTPPTTNSTYTIATSTVAGLVKPVSVITKPTINSVTTTSGKYYSVQMSSDGAMFVNVPWSSYDLVVGRSNSTWNETVTSNGQVYLKLYDRTTNGYGSKQTLNIVGADGLNVTSSATGKLYIAGGGYYHSTGSWNDLTYTAASNNNAPKLDFTIPTGTTSTTVALGNHTHTTFDNDVAISSGCCLDVRSIKTYSSFIGGTTSTGSYGQVLKCGSNGRLYWGIDSTGTDYKASSSDSSETLYLVGVTAQSTSATEGKQTYSNSLCYASGGYLYSNGVKVDMRSVGIEWGTF